VGLANAFAWGAPSWYRVYANTRNTQIRKYANIRSRHRSKATQQQRRDPVDVRCVGAEIAARYTENTGEVATVPAAFG
jgi:hypothetical protein